MLSSGTPTAVFTTVCTSDFFALAEPIYYSTIIIFALAETNFFFTQFSFVSYTG
jgi:hypothetical protein